MAGEMTPTENQRNRREIMYITKESQIKRVRAVIVYDISIRNNLKELNEVTAILENHAQRNDTIMLVSNQKWAVVIPEY
jgi:hypothetical protein